MSETQQKEPTSNTSSTSTNNNQVQRQEFIYCGPVPPPQVMKQLNDIVPGAADRILAMAEKEQDRAISAQENAHRRASAAARYEFIENITSILCAFIVCLFFLGGGIYLILKGYVKTGSMMICGTLGGVIGSFLYGRRRIKQQEYK